MITEPMVKRKNKDLGGDIDNWSMDSLEDIVSRYIADFPNPKQSNQESSSDDEGNNSISENNPNEKENSDNLEEEVNPLEDEIPNQINPEEIEESVENPRKESIRDIESDEEKEIIGEKQVNVVEGPQLPSSFVKQRQLQKEKLKEREKKSEIGSKNHLLTN